MDDTHQTQLLQLGRDTGRGNLLGIQPWMTPEDYRTAATLFNKLASYLKIARQRDWLNARTIVVWPEYLGTWLAVTGTGRAVVRARSLTGAMAVLALHRPGRLLRALLKSREKDRFAAAIFRARAGSIAQAYQAVFSQLARTYRVTMVAGSTVLPMPYVEKGHVVAGDGPLYGVTAVFAPDGRAYPDLVRKVHPVGSELPFLTPAAVDSLPVFGTPAGRLGVLICADAWYPAPYERMKAQGAELIAVPSYIASPGVWHHPWRGYDGAPRPGDVAPEDVGELTEEQAWHKYALAGRITGSSARAGINVFLAGKLWDLGGEGRSLMVTAEGGPIEADEDRSALITVWL